MAHNKESNVTETHTKALYSIKDDAEKSTELSSETNSTKTSTAVENGRIPLATESPNDTIPSAKKKRGAERQITKDDFKLTEDDNTNKEDKRTTGFQKASTEVLKNRRIVRVSRPGHDTAGKNARDSREKGTETTQKTNVKPDDNICITKDTKNDRKENETNTTNPFKSISLSSMADSNPFTMNYANNPPMTTEGLGFSDDAVNSKKPSSRDNRTGKVYGFQQESLNSTSPSPTAKASIFGSASYTRTTRTDMVFGQTTSKGGFGSVVGHTSDAPNCGFRSMLATVLPQNASTSGCKTSFFGSGTIALSGTSVDASTLFSNSIAPSSNCLTPEGVTPNSFEGVGKTALSVVSNGEEDEKCIFQTRVKLFKLVVIVNKNDKEEHEVNTACQGVFHGVPPSIPSSGITCVSTTSNGEDKEEKQTMKDQNQTKCEGEKRKADSQAPLVLKHMTNDKKWTEVGIGPLRILEKHENFPDIEKVGDKKKDDTEHNNDGTETKDRNSVIRIVQRRESTPGGQGTKLILNLLVRPECMVSRKSDKYVHLTSLESTHGAKHDAKLNEDVKYLVSSFIPVQYLLKVKTITDADELQIALEKGIASCSH